MPLKLIFVHFVLFLSFSLGKAQTLKREVLGSVGGTSFGEGYSIKSTIGQPSNTMRFSGQDVSLRQGFQQPVDSKIKIKPCRDCDISISPNPITDIGTITIPMSSPSYDLILFDLVGRVIFERKSQKNTSQDITSQQLSSGQYLAVINYSNGCSCSQKIIVK